MNAELTFVLDGRVLSARRGQTILEAAEAAGVYIPRLCHMPGLEPFGGCRVCTVQANGRHSAACTQPVTDGLVVTSESEELNEHRKLVVELLFVEGNHFCMACELSGNCELQALGYRLGIAAPRFEYQFPVREVDASHPDVLIDHNRCILCTRCVRSSRDQDHKSAFSVVERGPAKRIAASKGRCLAQTELAVGDRALEACPVGALMPKRVGFATPVGRRDFDHEPIGSATEAHRTSVEPEASEE